MTFLDLFKDLIITFFAYMVYRRIADKKPILSKPIIVGVYVAFPALTLFFLSSYVVEPLNAVITVIAHGLLASIIEKTEFKRKVFYFGISCSVSYILYLIALFISSVIFVTITNTREINFPFILLVLTIEAILMLVIHKIKKFKTTIDYNKNLTSAGTAIAGITLIIYSVLRVEGRLPNTQVTLLIVGIVLCGLGIYWWLKKESITNFNENAHKLTNESLQAEIEDLNAFCLELEKDRHTQNKKLPAYREAVELAIAGDLDAKLKAREFLIAAQSVKCETGSIQMFSKPLIDAILHFNNMRCDKCGIKFKSVGTKITSAIKESLLETLIANLLDNSMNSHENNSNQEKHITVHFDEDSLTVNDNGKPFTESVLADMARCKETLTPNRGDGVGIGFVTIFEITNECGASVEVTQNDEEKSVTIRFDSKNQFIVANNIGRAYVNN